MQTSFCHATLGALSILFMSCGVGPEQATLRPASTSQSALSAERPTIDESIFTLTQKRADTLERVTGPTASSEMTVIRAGHAEVLVAKKNADGTTSRRCVGSSDEATAFFSTAPNAPLKAADR